uniref:Uncharacterized protein n=1 Tax=Arundo donax TaxID=35708 RepID=A0A0A9CA51_ARUDO
MHARDGGRAGLAAVLVSKVEAFLWRRLGGFGDSWQEAVREGTHASGQAVSAAIVSLR